MTAEERLQEKYREEVGANEMCRNRDVYTPVHIDRTGAVYITSQDIDLIADLVVERLDKVVK